MRTRLLSRDTRGRARLFNREEVGYLRNERKEIIFLFSKNNLPFWIRVPLDDLFIYGLTICIGILFSHTILLPGPLKGQIQLLKFLVSFQKTAIRLLARASVLRSTLQCRPWMAPIKWSTRTAFRRAVSHQDSGNPEAGWWTCTWAGRRRMNGHICIEAIRQTVEDQLKFPEFCWWTIFSGREGRRMFPWSVCVWEKWGFCTRRRLGRIWKGMDAKGKRRII